MPPRQRRTKPKKRSRALVPLVRSRRGLMFNPTPVFTETFALRASGSTGLHYQLAPNLGGVLSVSMDNLPQLSQYNTLYQKYRILKAKFICIPDWNTESADINASSYNISISPTPVLATGLSRIVYAVNDSPDQIVAPVSEDVVLKDNGCKIVCGKPKLTMSCRPVPDTSDANGVQMTFKNKYINFSSTGVNRTHYGITWFHTQPGTGAPGTNMGVAYNVYCKLTFQLSDPR